MKYDTPSDKDYSFQLIRPMTENGEEKPIVEPGHVLDAFIVAGIVFLSVLLGDALLSLQQGQTVVITVEEISRRLITAGLAFGLTFLAQWARYRGIKFMVSLPVTLDTSTKEKEEDK